MRELARAIAIIVLIIYLSHLLRPLQAIAITSLENSETGCDAVMSIGDVNEVRGKCSAASDGAALLKAQCGAFELANTAIILNGVMEVLTTAGYVSCSMACVAPTPDRGLACLTAGMLGLTTSLIDVGIVTVEGDQVVSQLNEAQPESETHSDFRTLSQNTTGSDPTNELSDPTLGVTSKEIAPMAENAQIGQFKDIFPVTSLGLRVGPQIGAWMGVGAKTGTAAAESAPLLAEDATMQASQAEQASTKTTAMQHVRRWLPCVVAVLNAAMMGVIATGIESSLKTRSKACHAIKQLSSQSGTGGELSAGVGSTNAGTGSTTTGVDVTTTGTGTDGSGTATGSTTGERSSTTGAGTGGTTGTGTGTDTSQNSNGSAATASEIAAATEKYITGGLDLRSMGGLAAKVATSFPPNARALSLLLSTTGMNLSDVATQAMKGQGVSPWLSSMPQLPLNLTQQILRVDGQIRDGTIHLKGLSSVPFENLDDRVLKSTLNLSNVSPTVLKEMRKLTELDRAPSRLDLNQGIDIWHTNWTHNIFEIISDRLKTVQHE